jgi:hypothetical protein
VDDNTFTDDSVVVTLPGDVDGDRDVTIFDIVRIALGYSTIEGQMWYATRCDVDDDGDIDIFDVIAAAVNYGESW